MHFAKTKINSPNSFIKNELGEFFEYYIPNSHVVKHLI